MEAGSAGADEHDLPGDGVRIEAVLQDRPCRNVAGRLVLGEPHPKATLGIGRYLELPDPDETDTGVLAERPDPARARRLDDVGRRPLRDPQRLGRKRRIERVLQRQEQGHVSDHLIAVRRRVDGAVAAGRRLQLRQVRDRIGEVAHEELRIVAGDREGGLLLRDARRARPAGLRLERRAGQGPCGQRVRSPPSVALKRRAVRHGGAGLGLGQNEPGHHRGLRDGGGENAVVRWQDSHRVPKREHLEGRRPQLQRLLGRAAIRFREHDIEGDRRGAGRGEALDQVRQVRARPRPLADAGERFVVDIDDLDRQVRIVGARREALVGVERQPPEFPERQRIPDAQPEHRREDDERNGADQDPPHALPGSSSHKQPDVYQIRTRSASSHRRLAASAACSRTQRAHPGATRRRISRS